MGEERVGRVTGMRMRERRRRKKKEKRKHDEVHEKGIKRKAILQGKRKKREVQICGRQRLR